VNSLRSSAGFQSAVSQNCILLPPNWEARCDIPNRWAIAWVADYKSAIQQIENPRYQVS
jgi:hypothetical protein